MVAPRELNVDAGWTLIQSKKTRKERQKAKEENLTAFLALPSIQKDDESVAKLSEKSASSSKHSMKLKLNIIFNNNKSNKLSNITTLIKNMMKLSAYYPPILTFLITSQSCLLQIYQKRAVIHSH